MKYTNKRKRPVVAPPTTWDEGENHEWWLNEATEAYECAFWRLVGSVEAWGRQESRIWRWVHHMGHCGEVKFAAYKPVWRAITRHLGVAGTSELYEFRVLGARVAAAYRAWIRE